MMSRPVVVNAAGWFHILSFGLVLPAPAVLARRKVVPAEGPLPSRLRYFRGAALGLVMLTTLSLLVARARDMTLLPRAWPAAVESEPSPGRGMP